MEVGATSSNQSILQSPTQSGGANRQEAQQQSVQRQEQNVQQVEAESQQARLESPSQQSQPVNDRVGTLVNTTA